ncbi:c-type cytochrome [Antarctobacter sp.]|uniref:c-type cytochrome n=1 Tax=Antarctobacter sp. TaxID=1872577 RepID=UPI002B277AB2|nr:c-type cytochrome [Antarctobacter sp.]
MRKLSTALTLLGATTLAVGMAQAQNAEVGASYFGQYCATCHGMDAKGDGPMTQMMTVMVPDLTLLSADADGKFPMLDVIHIIDGRTGLRAHGGPMPVYGAVFRSESGGDTSDADVLFGLGKVLSIAYYLESVQQ